MASTRIYTPAEWPNNEIEKQVIEYGSIIACDETIAASLGISLEDLQKANRNRR